MKKTLLATAIAGAAALAATSASAATVYNQDGTKLDIYGNIQLVYAYDDRLGEDAESELGDNGSTFGAKGEHKINDDIVGYFKAEWEYDADESKGGGNGLNDGDQSYVGAKGSFGDARIGSWDQLMDDWIQDPISNNEYFDVSDSNTFKGAPGEDATDDSVVAGDPEGDKVTYTSPVWGGFQFALGTQYKGDAESENLTDSGEASIFGGLKYTYGGFSIAGVYDDLGIYDIDSGNGFSYVDDNGDTVDVGAADDLDLGDQYGVTMQYQWDSLRVAVKYERFESDNDLLKDADYYAIGARYGYLNGMGDIYGSYQYVDFGGNGFSDLDTANDDENDDDNHNEVVAGVTYNISDAMYTYVEGAVRDRDNDQGDGYAVGLTYLF